MSLVTNITSLAQRIATEFRAIRVLISGTTSGNVSGLTTSATNLVDAINEINAKPSSGVTINDSVSSTSSVYSSSKTDLQISTAINDLVGAAPGTLNTLEEIAAALNNDANIAATVTSAINNKVSKAGDTMTGPLTLAADPVIGLEAATKQYVDNGLFNKANSADVYSQTQVDNKLANKVDVGASVQGSGLVTVGGSLGMSGAMGLTIGVSAASQAEMNAGTRNDVVVTPLSLAYLNLLSSATADATYVQISDAGSDVATHDFAADFVAAL